MGAGEQNYFPQKSVGDGCWGLADENGFLQGMTDFFFFKLESATSHPHSPFPSRIPHPPFQLREPPIPHPPLIFEGGSQPPMDSYRARKFEVMLRWNRLK